MSIDYQTLLNWNIPEITQTITRKDTILYALGIGMGSDPVDSQQLRYVYEADLETLPMMAVTLCYPGQWHSAHGTGIISSHVVQGAQAFVIHYALPSACTVRGKTRITGVYDKGIGRGGHRNNRVRCVQRRKWDSTVHHWLNAFLSRQRRIWRAQRARDVAI